MSAMNNSHKSRPGGRGPEYVWEYEYYDDDEPVSFEGLKAHRYSIVIGFWVGLAVFVIFMFFVLTLLTKTGAPHQENPEPCNKRLRLASCVVDISQDQGSGKKVCSRPLIDESRSIFRCYISEDEEQQQEGEAECREEQGRPGGHAEPIVPRRDKEASFLQHFNIPNVVNSEHSSMLGDDDLLLCEPPIIMDSESRPSSTHDIIS